MIKWLALALIGTGITAYCIGKAMMEYGKEQTQRYESPPLQVLR